MSESSAQPEAPPTDSPLTLPDAVLTLALEVRESNLLLHQLIEQQQTLISALVDEGDGIEATSLDGSPVKFTS